LETLLTQRKELGSPDQSQAGLSGARVISFASPPLAPSFPKIGISMAAIFVVAVLLGITIAFIREIRRRGLTTLEQLEGLTGVAALGIIPAVKSRSQRRTILGLLSSQPNSPFAQALKTISWQLKELAGAKNNTIVVTSSVPEEGKTTLCVGLASIRAKKGYRVLVIDADIRKPDVHKKLGLAQAPGLRDVLEGTCKVGDAIVFDEASSIHVLTAGMHSPDALDVLDSQAFFSLLALLGEEYDCIFVDSPPVSVGPDASVLSKHADATVFAVRWSKTPRPGIEYSLRNLRQHGGNMVGALLTMVDLSQASSGHYGYYGYYGEKATR
jgi:capsular exopolysaccharide synthesis family protein